MNYTIEMRWQCSICQKLGNRGLARRCAGCGKPRDETDREYFPDDVSEAATIDGDDDGYDRKCPYCKYLNDAGWNDCSNCGAPRADGGLSYKTKELSLTENGDGSGRAVSEREVVVRGSGAFDAPIEPDVKWPPDEGGRLATRITVIAGIVLLVGFLLFWLFSPKYVDARVTKATWEHVVHVERYRVVDEEGWSAPGGAFEEKDVGTRVHHYDKVLDHYKTVHFTERYQCGTTPVTTSRSCRSKGDGTANCTTTRSGGNAKYCSRPASRQEAVYRSEPRYAMWRAWKAWRWKFDRDIRKSGSGTKTAWPAGDELKPPAPLREGEQERTSREGKYRVAFTDADGEKYEPTVKTEGEFVRYAPGLKRRLRVTPFSVEVQP